MTAACPEVIFQWMSPSGSLIDPPHFPSIQFHHYAYRCGLRRERAIEGDHTPVARPESRVNIDVLSIAGSEDGGIDEICGYQGIPKIRHAHRDSC